MDKLEQAKQILQKQSIKAVINRTEKNSIVASKILEEILPKHFQFRLWQSEITESGNFVKDYSEKSEEIFKNLQLLLDNYYTN